MAKDRIVFKKSQYGQVNLFMIENLLLNNGISPRHNNYNVRLEGLELLYHLLKNCEMSYKNAVELMIKHNQDMTFLKEIESNKKGNK